MTARPNLQRKEIEWRALQLLCAHFPSDLAHEKMDGNSLRVEDFADPVHRVLFEEILRGAKNKMSAEEFRRWLPAAMTRKGWPDLDFDSLFRTDALPSSREALLDAARTLRILGGHVASAPK